MERISKPENLTVYRKKGLTVLGGLLSLLLAAALITFITVAYLMTPEETVKEVKTSVIIAFTGVGIGAFFLISNTALCLYNLRYPVILATDEKGIYDYSGFIHCGFIGWNDILEITGCGNRAEAFIDLFENGSLTEVKIELRNRKATFANRSKLWTALFIMSGFGTVRIRTMCSPLSKKITYALLNERLKYYTES